MWLDTQFQIAVAKLSLAVVQRRLGNYQAIRRLPNSLAWHDLTVNVGGGDLGIDTPVDVLEVSALDDPYELYDPERFLPTSLAEVEAVKSMHFQPDVEMTPPNDLFDRIDKTTETQLLSEYRHRFDHSASSSFLAYVPLYFWKQVVPEPNQFAAVKTIRITTPFTIDELMFLGIMFYLALAGKG